MGRSRKARPSPRGRRGDSGTLAGSFASVLKPLVAPGGEGSPTDHEPLAHLSYAAEVAAKQEALKTFWRRQGLAGVPERLVRSPLPRGYRTSSKRRVVVQRGKTILSMSDRIAAQESSVVVSALEPAEHGQIYAALRVALNQPTYALLARHLNYLILRGSYRERALIFNVDELSGALVRKLKMMTERLRDQPIGAFFAYLDPSRSDYFFESRRPDQSVTFKKLSGPEQIRASFCDCRYSYHPTSFSQVNDSIVPELLTRARELLAPDSSEHLLDLYCGYGLFSHYLAPGYKSVVGVDVEGPSIRSATANGRLNPSAAPKKFLAARIDREFVSRTLRRPAGPEVVLLDPPRNGPQALVIPALAERRPHKVLHVFCDVDQIPAALEQWQSAGYQVRTVVPLDMFPGSANLEVLVLLTPDRSRRSS